VIARPDRDPRPDPATWSSDRLARAAAWRLAAELATRVASGSVTEDDDELVLTIPWTLAAPARTLRISARDDTVRGPSDDAVHAGLLASLVEPGAAARACATLLDQAGPFVEVTRPSALAVTYRTLATVLLDRIFDENLWEVRATDAPQGWRIVVGDHVVATTEGAHARTTAGEHLDLHALYRAGASFGDLAARLTRRGAPPEPVGTPIPDSRAPDVEIAVFAGTYDAYARWARTPAMLGAMVDAVITAHAEGGLDGFGVDALRATAFFSMRAHRFTDSEADWRRVVDLTAELSRRYGSPLPTSAT
jgi:hypothetical protein